MLCGSQSITAAGSFGGAAIPVKCRSWLCPNCADMRRRQLIRLGFSGQPERFITITCRRDQYKTPDRAAQALSAAWRTIVLRWRRLREKNKCEYLCVFEAHKSGWPHLHILWRGPWIDWHWLKKQTTALINSPHVYIEDISRIKSVAAYVTKYCGKAAHKFGTAKRYWTSKGWSIIKDTDVTLDFPRTWKWERVRQSISEIKAEWIRHGKIVYDMPPDAIAWGCLIEYDHSLTRTPHKEWRRTPTKMVYE